MPEIIFSGPEGRIEGRYHHVQEKTSPVALVLHPHPLHGGTMNNKVAYNLYQTFVQNGFSVMRFNFRGVGRSQGTFDNGVGELSDAAAALDWLQLQNPDASSYWIAGFSFGAWIALQLLMRRPELRGFITVSPPAGAYDFSFLSPCPASGLVLQGTEDSIVDINDVNRLAEKLQKQKNITVDYHTIEGADHFFRTSMEALTEKVDQYVKMRLEKDDFGLINMRVDKKRRQPMPA